LKAVIDRFEGEYAVLLVGEEESKVDLPLKLLPKGAIEGSVLDLNLSLDHTGGKARKERIKGKLEKLKGKYKGKE